MLQANSNVTVKNFNINGGQHFGSYDIRDSLSAGIYLKDVSNSDIANNNITNVLDVTATFVYYQTVAGIVIIGGHSNVISGNKLIDNFQGMTCEQTTDNLIVENTISLSTSAQDTQGYNKFAGAYFSSSSNNTIYHNNFEISHDHFGQNVTEAKDSYSANIWDNGYPSGGNYWMNYNGKEINGTGIGETPYVIDGPNENSKNVYNTDRYPLMKPFNSTFFTLQITPPKIVLTSPTNQTYNESSISLSFSLSVFSSNKTIDWAGYSLDGEQNVTVIGDTTITNMTNGVHTIALYANDTFGNVGASQTINFTVAKPAKPFPTLATVAIVSLIGVAVVGAGLSVYYKKRKR